MLRYVAGLLFLVAAVVYALSTEGALTVPEDVWAGAARAGAETAWADARQHPAPYIVALATFGLTAVYHRRKGASLREALLAAGAKAAVVAGPNPDTYVCARARARALKGQLEADLAAAAERTAALPKKLADARASSADADQQAHRAEVDARAARALAEEAADAVDEFNSDLAAARQEVELIKAELAELGRAHPGL